MHDTEEATRANRRPSTNGIKRRTSPPSPFTARLLCDRLPRRSQPRMAAASSL